MSPAGASGQRLKDLLARDPILKLAVAESVTCGGLQQRLGRISGASEFFLGGITAYDRAQKIAHLGVDDAEARAVNSVSQAVAEQMARGVCVLFGADVGLATTGYAEASPQWRAALPYAYWAIARREGQFPRAVASGRIDCPGLGRAEAQDRMCEAALAELIAQAEGWRAAPRPTA
ncbi:MAG TPA: nicotinamide-nucleotide amidohydrolase family protein [Opitutaceae bacterium]|jgi:nicotinamide-nucleotide amidase|nr:nicotinamide-nucleotide amidohydrolase family protein [Opitutaceae bacterium]